MRIKADQTTTRAMNRRMILERLRTEGALSRAALSQRTGLSAAAMTTVTNDLIAEGLVSVGEAGESSGGRKPIPLSVNYSARLSIGLKLMQRRIDAVLTDLAVGVIATASADDTSHDPAAVADTIAALVAKLTTSHDPAKLVGVGIAVPGYVNTDTGVCIRAIRLGWENVPIAALVAARIDLPVWIDNDVNAYAIAHRLFGLGLNCRSALVFVIGTGIGAAMIIDGKIHRGARFTAGEIGFTRAAGGGAWGRAHTDVGLNERWHAMHPAAGPLRTEAANGHPQALKLLEQDATAVAERLAILIDMTDPEVVIIGGEALSFGPHYYSTLDTALSAMVMPPAPRIALDHNNDLWTRGAAVLAIDHFFDFESVAGVRG